MTYLIENFETFEDWSDYAARNPWIFDNSFADEIGYRIKAEGFAEPLTGLHVPPSALVGQGDRWREELFANGLNSRTRAVMLLLGQAVEAHGSCDVSIYAAEALTSLALLLRGRFARFYGSEYLENEDEVRKIFPIPHQNLLALTLPSESFDIAMSNEVLEHVPDIDMALAELARIVKPGGSYIGTMPFLLGSKTSIRRASLIDGRLVHHMEPEYHGNPVRPTEGSLVFEVPGWDILDRTRAAGFSRAQMTFVASSAHGVLTENTGVFVLRATK